MNADRRYRLPRARIILLAILALAWFVSSRLSIVYVVPFSPRGPIADGDSLGYEDTRAFGLAQGSLVRQTRHRVHTVGWVVSEEECGFRLLPFESAVFWPVHTVGLPLILLIVLLGASLLWRGRRFRKLPSDLRSSAFIPATPLEKK
jgi:hypothetical protein